MTLTKISVLVDPDLAERLKRTLPWGFKRHFMEAVAKLVLDAVERDGNVILGAIMDGDYALTRVEKSDGGRKPASRR